MLPRERCVMMFLEVAIGAMAAALLAVPVLMAVTGRKAPGSDRQRSQSAE